MADQSASPWPVPVLPDPAAAVASAALSLWLLALAGVVAPVAALAAGPRPPTTAVGATQLLLVALAPPALLYVPYAVRRQLRPAVGAGRAAAAVAAGAVLAAVAVVAAGAVALPALAGGGAPAASLPALALVLPAFGVWLHRRSLRDGDPEAWAGGDRAVVADLRRPGRLVADARTAGNAALVGTHALVLAAAGNLAWRLAARGSATALLLVVALAYGGWYVGQAFVVRLGVWEPWRGL